MGASYDWEKLIDLSVWFCFKKCNCGGSLKWKYRKVVDHNEQLWIFPNRRIYERLRGNERIKGGPIEELQSALEI